MYWTYCSIFLFILALLDRGRYSTLSYKFSLFVLLIFATGNYYNGIDWVNYQYHYSSVSNVGLSVDYFAYEPGFMFLLYFFGYLLEITNFHVIVFFSSLLAVLSISIFLKKISIKINRSLFILITVLFIFPLFNDAIRQLLAFSIVLPFLPDIRQHSIKKIVVVCGVASLFHASAILVIPLCFVLRMQFCKKFMLVTLVIAFGISIALAFLGVIISMFDGLIPQLLYLKLLNYLDKTAELKLGLFAVVDLIGISIIYSTSQLVKQERHLSVYAVGGFLFFVLHLTFYFAPFLQRFLYFIFPLSLIYAESLFRYGNKFTLAKILLPVIMLMCLLVFYRNITNPYYSSDFNEPKFFYSEIFNSNPINVDNLMVRKCLLIGEFDPNFCPR